MKGKTMRLFLVNQDAKENECPLKVSSRGDMALLVGKTNPFVSSIEEVSSQKFFDVLYILKKNNKILEGKIRETVSLILSIVLKGK